MFFNFNRMEAKTFALLFLAEVLACYFGILIMVFSNKKMTVHYNVAFLL